MGDTNEKYGMGWIPDYPDLRDYRMDNYGVSTRLKELGQQKSVRRMLQATGVDADGKKLPASVDLRQWFPPVEDQGELGSCTANAGVGLVEYFQRRSFKKHLDASRLFLYKTTRNLMHASDDSGA